MPIYDYIIVGGGISGLFMSYKLSQTGKNILLVESANRLGGRIHTVTKDGIHFEAGAARIGQKHHKMMSLLKELELDDQLTPLSDKIKYNIKGPSIRFESLVNDLLQGSKLYTKKYLQGINLYQLCIDVLGYEGATLFKDMLGYDSEFSKLNAYQGIKSYTRDLFSDTDYYTIKEGLSVVINTLSEKLSESDNVTIKMETKVSDIGSNYVLIGKTKIYSATIICCTPYDTIKRLPKFSEVKEIHSVSPIPVLRIYATYPKDTTGHVWFHDVPRTITDNYIRQIIPIDYEKGIIMISYTDGLYADMWSNLSKQGNKVLIERLHKELKEVLGKKIPKPDFITTHYWSAGIHLWKPGLNVKEEYQKVLQPFQHEKIFVVNEAYSLHQGWMEGSLESAYDVLELLHENFEREKPKKGGSQTVSKIYSLETVLKKKTWIVLDIKKQLRIYDVAKWLSKHPGGKANLEKGIEANKHYKDSIKHPDSPIHLFKGISAHSDADVIEKKLLTKNEYVRYIGIMKKV